VLICLPHDHHISLTYYLLSIPATFQGLLAMLLGRLSVSSSTTSISIPTPSSTSSSNPASSSTPTSSLNALISDLQLVCCETEYAYVWSQRVLKTLQSVCQAASASSTEVFIEATSLSASSFAALASIFARLSHTLSTYASSKHGISTIALYDLMCSNLFLPTAATSTPSLPGSTAPTSSINTKSSAVDSDLVSVFSSLIRTSDLTPLDITRLFTKYSSPDPPSVQYLRNPLLFRSLISQLFRDVDGTVNNITPENKKKMLYLLAYAAEAIDERDNNSQNIHVKIVQRILSKKRKDPDSAPPTKSDSFDVLSRIVNKSHVVRSSLNIFISK